MGCWTASPSTSTALANSSRFWECTASPSVQKRLHDLKVVGRSGVWGGGAIPTGIAVLPLKHLQAILHAVLAPADEPIEIGAEPLVPSARPKTLEKPGAVVLGHHLVPESLISEQREHLARFFPSCRAQDPNLRRRGGCPSVKLGDQRLRRRPCGWGTMVRSRGAIHRRLLHGGGRGW